MHRKTRSDKGVKRAEFTRDTNELVGTFKFNRNDPHQAEAAAWCEQWRASNPNKGWRVMIQQLIKEEVPVSPEDTVTEQLRILAELIEQLKNADIQLTRKAKGGKRQDVDMGYLSNMMQSMFKKE